MRASSPAAAVLFLLLAARAPAQPVEPQFQNRPERASQSEVAGRPVIPHTPERLVSATVSVARLLHKVPGRARKEFEKALVCGRKGDSQAAVAHLEKAIEIDPAYLEAYNNLGVGQMLLNQPERAIVQYRQALSLDGAAGIVHANLGIAYTLMRRFPEAEGAARQGLRYDRTSNSARLVLGVALEAQRREPQEALENLQAAAREFPRAHLVAARILAQEGERNRAAVELRKYLRSGFPNDRQQVQTWLAELVK